MTRFNPKPKVRLPRLHDLVVLRDSRRRICVITEIFDHGGKTLYQCHYVDHKTGLLMECPDKARCGHKHTCPIHGANCEANGFTLLPVKDAAFYVTEGMLSEALLTAAGYEPPQTQAYSIYVQCVAAGGKKGDFIALAGQMPPVAISPVFDSLAELYPWMRDNGWRSAENVGDAFIPWRVVRAVP